MLVQEVLYHSLVMYFLAPGYASRVHFSVADQSVLSDQVTLPRVIVKKDMTGDKGVLQGRADHLIVGKFGALLVWPGLRIMKFKQYLAVHIQEGGMFAILLEGTCGLIVDIQDVLFYFDFLGLQSAHDGEGQEHTQEDEFHGVVFG